MVTSTFDDFPNLSQAWLSTCLIITPEAFLSVKSLQQLINVMHGNCLGQVNARYDT